MRPDDAEAVRRISSSITRGTDQTDYHGFIEKQAESEADASLVAVRENRLVGYCVSHVLAGSFGVEQSAWIANFGVEPDFMGQGIGEMLARETLKHFKAMGITNVYTSVRWDATDMLSFFKTLGFQRSDFINLYKSLA